MDITHEISSIPLTSGELAFLWNGYILNSKAKHILMYAVSTCNDKDIRAVLQLSMDLSAKAMDRIGSIFQNVNQPVPYGFTEADVNINAQKLYSDKLMLYLLKVYCMVGLSNYGTAISVSARGDVRQFFTDNLISTLDLLNKIDSVALEKGIYIRTPNINVTPKVEYAEDESVMGRLIGHKRPFTVMEITQVFNIAFVCSISAAQFLGIGQVARDEDVKRFSAKVYKTLREQIESLNELLVKEDLDVPPRVSSEVLNSTDPPFSEKLGMFFNLATLADTISAYSIGKIGIMRKDTFLTVSQLSSEILLLLKEATELMVEKGWYEEMPKNIDRKDLMEISH